MGDHDLIGPVTIREDDYGNEFSVARCRCGRFCVGADEAQAVEAHEKHHHAAVVGLPGVAGARAELERAKGEQDGS